MSRIFYVYDFPLVCFLRELLGVRLLQCTLK